MYILIYYTLFEQPKHLTFVLVNLVPFELKINPNIIVDDLYI